jgi:hypothetical protein
VAVVILRRGSPIGVRLTMSSSAPPQTGRIEPVRVFDDAGGIIAAKGRWSIVVSHTGRNQHLVAASPLSQ